MGVDYKWGGSAGGMRYGREIDSVLKVFHGTRIDNGPGNKKYIFPDGTHPSIMKFFECTYGPLTLEETKDVWEEFQKHPEIQQLMPEMWHEFEMDVRYGEPFELSY